MPLRPVSVHLLTVLPNESGAVSLPFQRLPMTTGNLGSPDRNTTSTSSPVSGNMNAPLFLPANGIATRAHTGPSSSVLPSQL